MSITARRLGQSGITIDWTNLPSTQHDFPKIQTTWENLQKEFSENTVGFFHSVTNEDISNRIESETLAKEILKNQNIRDCLFLGIGGSALGPISLLSALAHRCIPNVRFHFMENPDPIDWRFTLSRLNPENTLVCGVTKSGKTFETMAQVLLALDWLGEERWTTHFLAITDPRQGDLRVLVNQKKLRSLPIHPSIGGRFSIFTPVGCFPASLAGLQTIKFMEGANEVRNFVLKTPTEKNPLFLLGSHLVSMYPKRSVHVCMPYSTRLRSIGLWWTQLWGESLGKDGKGFTPLAAVGATDQHSILQLLRDGPDDKVTSFVTVDSIEDPVSLKVTAPIPPLASFQMLAPHSLQKLLEAEYQATVKVLTRQNRPNFSFRMDRLDEHTLGALYFSFAVLTSFTGRFWGINPFDQPGVEEGKIYTRETLHPSSSDSN